MWKHPITVLCKNGSSLNGRLHILIKGKIADNKQDILFMTKIASLKNDILK